MRKSMTAILGVVFVVHSYFGIFHIKQVYSSESVEYYEIAFVEFPSWGGDVSENDYPSRMTFFKHENGSNAGTDFIFNILFGYYTPVLYVLIILLAIWGQSKRQRVAEGDGLKTSGLDN